MTKISIKPLGPATTLQQLAQGVSGALQDLASQLASLEVEPKADLPMRGYRITNLSDPASGRDAVNRNYLEKRLAEVSLRGAAAVSLNSATGTTTVVTTQAVQISY